MFNFSSFFQFSPFESLLKWLHNNGLLASILAFFKSVGINEPLFFKIAQATDETLVMTFAAGFWGLLIGLPIGILLYVTRKGEMLESYTINMILSSLINIFRSIPFIILIVWMIPFTRVIVGTSIGLQAALVPLSIGVSPFIARMVENALLEVPKGLIEAARAMGATPLQIVRKVLLPEALPVLINSSTITLITLIGYVAMAGAVGAGGLGHLAFQYGYTMNKPPVMNTVLILLIIFVFIIQLVGNKLVRKATHA